MPSPTLKMITGDGAVLRTISSSLSASASVNCWFAPKHVQVVVRYSYLQSGIILKTFSKASFESLFCLILSSHKTGFSPAGGVLSGPADNSFPPKEILSRLNQELPKR